MPRIKLYNSAVVAVLYPYKKIPEGVIGGIRGLGVGWQSQSSRSMLRRKLCSVNVKTLPQPVYWCAFTLGQYWGDIPVWQFKYEQKKFMQYLEKLDGVKLIHWALEWQRRGAPHLHMLLCGGYKPMLWNDIPAMLKPSKIPKVSRQRVSDFLGVNADVGRAVDRWMSLPMVQQSAADKKYQWLSPLGYFGELEEESLWCYLTAHNANKEVQHKPPHNWIYPGRVWGFRGKWQFGECAEFDISKKGYYEIQGELGAGGQWGYSRVVHKQQRQKIMRIIRDNVVV